VAGFDARIAVVGAATGAILCGSTDARHSLGFSSALFRNKHCAAPAAAGRSAPPLAGAAREALRARRQSPVLEKLWRQCLGLQYTLLKHGRRLEQAAAALVRGTSELEADNRRLRRMAWSWSPGRYSTRLQAC